MTCKQQWVTGQGDALYIHEMTDQHLANTITYLERQLSSARLDGMKRSLANMQIEQMLRRQPSFNRPHLPIYDKEGLRGVFLDDICRLMPKADYDRFSTWFYGQTCALIDGRALVYEWDWDNYWAGGEAYD